MKRIILTVMAAFITLGAAAQTDGFKFTDTKTVPTTPVQNQASSGTCWSFSGLSFLESEILVAGGPEVDLSRMWVVRHAYFDRAVKYVRLHGTSNLSAGAAAEDVMICWRKHGIVPTEAYPGLNYGEEIHRHGELDAVIKAYCDAVIKNPNRRLSTAWQNGLNGILDAYLGEIPEKFTVGGKEYTPKSYAASLPVNIDDYVSITSYTHHPFDTWFILEIPDNTVWGESYNVPLDEMTRAIETAVKSGHPVLWASDVSEKGFNWRKGLAVIPDADLTRMDDSELARWVALSDAEKEANLYKLERPGREKEITQQMRQDAFDRWETTDDHGMVIAGLAVDQYGNDYYRVQNSWGSEGHIFGGFFYASHPFVAYKTMSVMIHRDALPKDLKKKLK